ncbi:unnamed protein product [Coregonus sp. 'balchen']|nr:unnamed protein product [Coregonus sp. 'balchen']
MTTMEAQSEGMRDRVIEIQGEKEGEGEMKRQRGKEGERGIPQAWPRYRVLRVIDVGQYNLEISAAELNRAVPMGKRTTVTLNVHHPPKVNLSMEPQSVLEGERVTFTCQATANPPIMGIRSVGVCWIIFNAVGHTNLSILVNVHYGGHPLNDLAQTVGHPAKWILATAGPPIISSEPVQYAVRGEKGEVKCYIASTPPPDKIGGAVLSTLTINNVMEADFHSPYNCTAWNAFGPGTMIITLEEKEIVPVGIIAGGTVGSSILLLIFLLALAFFLYRQRKGNDMDLKQDLRSELDTREEYELKDPTNGYYNVRATTHDEARPSSHSMLYQGEFRTSNPPGGATGATSSGPAGGPGGAVAAGGVPGVPGSRAGCYDPRAPSRMSHTNYPQFNTFTRAGQSQVLPNTNHPSHPSHHSHPASQTSDFPGDCGLLDNNTQLTYDNYGYPAQYPTYRMGFAPPLEGGPAYEVYPTGQGVGPGPVQGPIQGQGPCPGPGPGSETVLGKYGATCFSYTSPPGTDYSPPGTDYSPPGTDYSPPGTDYSPPATDYSPPGTDYNQRHTQRMQTHV